MVQNGSWILNYASTKHDNKRSLGSIGAGEFSNITQIIEFFLFCIGLV